MGKNISIFLNKTDEIITNRIRLILGFAFLVIAGAVDALNGFSDSSNSIVLLILTASFISFVNVIFVKAFHIRLNYILYMIGNYAGILAFLYVISRYNILSITYTALFCALVFIAMWIIEMCLFDCDSVKKRLFGSLLVNVVTVLSMGIAAVLVVTISFILKH